MKIVSDLPLKGSPRARSAQMVRGIEFILEKAERRAGIHSVEFEPFDDSDAAGSWDEETCAGNARTYAADEAIVGVIGPYDSGCAAVMIPLLNASQTAMISPAARAPGLTRAVPGASPSEPERYYPSGERNYARVVAPDDLQGTVAARLMREDLQVTRVFVLHDGEPSGRAMAGAFEAAARELGLELAGTARWDGKAQGDEELMARVEASRADGVYLAGTLAGSGGRLLADKASTVGDNTEVRLVVSEGFVLPAAFAASGGAIEGAYGIAPTKPVERLVGAGKALVEEFREREGGRAIEVETAYAMTAAQVLLDAISRSDGTRPDVTAKLLETDLLDTVVGSVRFDENGDVGVQSIYRAEGGAWIWLEEREAR